MLSEHERHHVFGLDAFFLMGICCSLHACHGFVQKVRFVPTAELLSFLLLFSLSVQDSLVTVCSWKTNVIMLWAWMLW